MRSRDRRVLAGRRLAAQAISEPRPGAADVASRLLAVQAQDYPSALWALGLRTASRDRAAIEHELEHGRLIRSWPMRGTLHILDGDDLEWLSSLTRERVIAQTAPRYRELGLEDADFSRAAAIADERLAATRLERRELLAAFEEEGLATTGQRGAHLLGRLAIAGRIVLCSGTRFARTLDRIPDPRRLDRPAALAELALRYLTGHGPATDRDLAWWAGITLTDARAGIAAVRNRLESVEIDGVAFLQLAGASGESRGTWALPMFDEYLLGYTDRRVPLGDSPLERVVPGRNGMFLATVVRDGEIVGTWRRGRRGRAGVELDIDWWSPPPPSRTGAVRRVLGEWSRFVGDPIASVPVSPGSS